MNRLFFKYYFDITRINVLVSIIIGIQHIAICFGTFGMLISFFIYHYYQREQYYFYLNFGFTKIKLISSGSFDVKMVNDSVYNIVCDFKTSDSLQLKGSFEAVLPHFDQSLSPKKVGSRNRFKL